MIRLRKPLAYYREKYGTYRYGLEKLYLMMEKQYNRGQEGAGVGVVKLRALPGTEYVWRERALGTQAIQEIFSQIFPRLAAEDVDNRPVQEVEECAPFVGEIYMGHLRYSTTGRSGLSYVHPFLRRNNWRSRNLLMCGNFNMTNVDEIFQSVVERGQHPRLYSDTIVILEQLGYALDRENHRIYRRYRDELEEPALTRRIEDEIDLGGVLRSCAPSWDGGFAMCGATGSGDMFVVRDRHGIRPAFYYVDDEIVVVASERPVIQTVMDVTFDSVKELMPGEAIMVNNHAEVKVEQILEPGRNERCSFERIYFSRGSDADIYQERKELGRLLVPQILRAIDHDPDNTVFSFIPNTAEVAFMGMIRGLEQHLDAQRLEQISELSRAGQLTEERLRAIMKRKIREEKVAIKDIKLRTFIAEGDTRNDLAAHVYDVTYGCVRPGVDRLVVIDDSIVRGTTLKQSILSILSRLNPRKIVVVSSSPQVRYPDCYGIDMSRMSEFIAFKAAVSLLRQSGREDLLREVYERCREELNKPVAEQVNCVRAIYEPFTDDEISAEIARLLRPDDCRAEVEIVYQTLENMHRAIPGHPGDWYFSGHYPTPGGTRLVNRAYVNFYEGAVDRR